MLSTRIFNLSKGFRAFSQESRSSYARHSLRRRASKIGEKSTTSLPSTSPISIGQGAVAGAAVCGLGALAFYGMGLSGNPGAIENSVTWPDVVKYRIRDTYAYFGASLGITAASAVAVFQTPRLMKIVASGGLMSLGLSIAAMVGSGVLVKSIPYNEGIGAKQAAWLLHAGIIGAVVAPICLLGGPLLTRAAWYTAGMVGGLSTVAVCAPSEKFLNMGGPLAMGFGVVFAASLGSHFLPPTTTLGLSLHSVALYGGLILFGMFLLYDTQKIIYKAERHPMYGVTKYDPINASVGIYLDTINIFMRIAQMLAMGGGKRK